MLTWFVYHTATIRAIIILSLVCVYFIFIGLVHRWWDVQFRLFFLFLYKKWLFHNVSWRQLRQQFGPIRQQSIGRINRSKACFFTSQATMSRNFSPLPLPHSSMKIPLIWRRKFYSYFKLPCSICLKFNQITVDCNEREGKAQLVNNQIAMLDCIWSI